MAAKEELGRTAVIRSSPAGKRSFLLKVISGPERGQTRPLSSRPVVVGSQPPSDLLLTGRGVSRKHAELVLRDGQLELRDLGSTNGTFVGSARIETATLRPGVLVQIGEVQLTVEAIEEETVLEPSHRESMGPLVGKSVAMRTIFALIERAGPTNATVLIEGETGTGKEMLARSMWEHSDRSEQPLVVIDCSALSQSLLESELFGHVKGAFTGAVENREGAFRRAHGGTVFIDEITALPIDVQPKLLRALEAREVRPVGSDRPQPIDVRIIAAADRDLEREVEASRFRADLFYRLSVVRVRIPPLRERPEDLELLVRKFVRLAGGEAESVDAAQLGRLRSHHWPGNIRELRNVVERAYALGGHLPFSQLPLAIGTLARASQDAPLFDVDLPLQEAKQRLVDRFERAYLRHAIEATQGNVAEAARRSGSERKHFWRLLQKYDLLPERDRLRGGDLADEDG